MFWKNDKEPIELFAHFNTSKIIVPVSLEVLDFVTTAYSQDEAFIQFETEDNHLLVLNCSSIQAIGVNDQPNSNKKIFTPICSYDRYSRDVMLAARWFFDATERKTEEYREWESKYESKMKDILLSKWMRIDDEIYESMFEMSWELNALSDAWQTDNFPKLSYEERLIYHSDYVKVMYKTGHLFTDSLNYREQYLALRETFDSKPVSENTVVKILNYESKPTYTKMGCLEFIAVPKLRYEIAAEKCFRDGVFWDVKE
jgi:hypothetical protein